MQLITIIGARPQFIKAAVVSRAIEKYSNENSDEKIQEIIVHTGQHYDVNMSDVFFDEMCIPRPDYNLAIHGSSHGAMTGQMLEQIEKVLGKEKPDLMLVYGDTNSTLAGALAAAKLHIPVAHVEAGLRSFNRQMPEEINRVLTDHISTLLFCPTQTAINNLANEGIVDNNCRKIFNIGDVMYDATLYYKQLANPTVVVKDLLRKAKDGFSLLTVHREENTDDLGRLKKIVSAMCEITQNTHVVWPVHPRTKKIMADNSIETGAIITIDPIGYFDMITLLSNCSSVFTDSGGVQKEAFFFQKPCITLRDQTEWVELVENGYNILAGAEYNKIVNAQKEFVGKEINWSKKLYGAGNSAEKIVEILSREF